MDKKKNTDFQLDIKYDDEKQENSDTAISEGNDEKPAVKKGWSKKKKALLIVIVIIGFIAILIGCVVGLIFHYIGMVNVVPDSSSYEILDSIEPDDDLTSGPDSPDEEKQALEEQIKENIEKNTGKSDADVKEELEKNATKLTYSDEVYNILLIGTDARDNTTRGRSDSMILVSLNKETHKIVMTSFLRDIYLGIPNIGSTRLNHAYAYGGPDLLIETLQQNFGIRIDKYVQVNFFSFIDVVDSVDGVEIDVTDDEVQYVNMYLKEINSLFNLKENDGALSSGGKLTLNGRQALAYARIRYIGTDFGRTQRQRTVLTKIIQKMKDASLSQLDELLETLLPEVSTNLTQGEMFSLVLDSPAYLGYDTEQYVVPEDNTYQFLTIDSMSVIGIDFQQNIDDIKSHIYG